MKITSLSLEQVEQIYHTHMMEDFPAAERKPFSSIKTMWENNIYSAYGAFEHNQLTGYAFFAGKTDQRFLLLDYFAVNASCRSAGHGSRFLTEIASQLKQYDGIFLEVEDPDRTEIAEEITIRKRRIDFYLKNLVKPTPLKVQLFHVPYKIMFLPLLGDGNGCNYKEELNHIYHSMFPDAVYQKHVYFLDDKGALYQED